MDLFEMPEQPAPPAGVRQLITAMERLPCDADVEITWEGTLRSIDEDNIYVSKLGVVIIDADCNHYKESLITTGRTH